MKKKERIQSSRGSYCPNDDDDDVDDRRLTWELAKKKGLLVFLSLCGGSLFVGELTTVQ